MSEPELDEPYDPLSDPSEQTHLLQVLDAFRSYRRLAHFNSTHVRRQAFYSMPSEHWNLLAQPPFSILDSLSTLDDLIDSNADLAESIFKAGFQAFIAPSLDSDWVASIVDEKYAHDEFRIYSTILDHMGVQATQTDLEKARSCVHQFYRDWSVEGKIERTKCFDPVVHAVETEFTARSQKDPELDRSAMSILVPGAGLGRLVFDFCRAGYTVEGNEISYHAVVSSYLILNQTDRAGQFKIAPFALSCSNHLNRKDQFKTVQVPDVHPGEELANASEGMQVPSSERMSMSSGDFCVLYSSSSHKDTFDVVATVFFIDTAPNLIRYIEAVRNCLRPEGLWVNLGPLLWHHASRIQCSGEDKEDKEKSTPRNVDAGIGDPGSVELTDNEIVKLVEHFGFTLEKHEIGQIETGYISNPNSMLQNIYRPSFWIARKKP